MLSRSTFLISSGWRVPLLTVLRACSETLSFCPTLKDGFGVGWCPAQAVVHSSLASWGTHADLSTGSLYPHTTGPAPELPGEGLSLFRESHLPARLAAQLEAAKGRLEAIQSQVQSNWSGEEIGYLEQVIDLEQPLSFCHFIRKIWVITVPISQHYS